MRRDLPAYVKQPKHIRAFTDPDKSGVELQATASRRASPQQQASHRPLLGGWSSSAASSLMVLGVFSFYVSRRCSWPARISLAALVAVSVVGCGLWTITLTKDSRTRAPLQRGPTSLRDASAAASTNVAVRRHDCGSSPSFAICTRVQTCMLLRLWPR